jgi:hypothetical protein
MYSLCALCEIERFFWLHLCCNFCEFNVKVLVKIEQQGKNKSADV